MDTTRDSNQDGIHRLLQIMATLRNPNGGCPWDLEQTFETIAPYTIEEAYEVSQAITDGNMAELKSELGDLLLQVVFHSQIASELNLFTFEDVANAISDKMNRRHPHVFKSQSMENDSDIALKWEDIKAQERQEKAISDIPQSVLNDIPLALPALMRATKLQKRAAAVGFDWTEIDQVMDKIQEELNEFRVAVSAAKHAGNTDAIEDELGDILFVYANVARHMNVCPEAALRRTNDKFKRRFQCIEHWLLEDGRTVKDATLGEMEDLWQRAKRLEVRKI